MGLPAHDEQAEHAAAGATERLRHGWYRAPDLDAELALEQLAGLAPRVAAVRDAQADAFDASEDELPPDLVRALLRAKYRETEQRLGVPVYRAVGWRRAADEQDLLRPPPPDEASQFIPKEERAVGERMHAMR